MNRPGPRLTRGLLLTAAVVAFVGLGAIWLWQYRRGQPIDIDEAGYLSIAVGDSRGLTTAGSEGSWDAVMGPSIQAPLMTALTAPVFALAGAGILTGLLVPLALGGVMVLAAYRLGHEVGGPRVGVADARPDRRDARGHRLLRGPTTSPIAVRCRRLSDAVGDRAVQELRERGLVGRRRGRDRPGGAVEDAHPAFLPALGVVGRRGPRRRAAERRGAGLPGPRRCDLAGSWPGRGTTATEKRCSTT